MLLLFADTAADGGESLGDTFGVNYYVTSWKWLQCFGAHREGERGTYGGRLTISFTCCTGAQVSMYECPSLLKRLITTSRYNFARSPRMNDCLIFHEISGVGGKRLKHISWLRMSCLANFMDSLFFFTFLIWHLLFGFVISNIWSLFFPCFFLFIPGLGFLTSLVFVFLIGIFVSSWLGATLFWLGEWLIKRMPFVKHIYSASKQISTAISPGIITSFIKCLIMFCQ